MLFKVHKNTVRQWLKSGLEPVDDRRPILILGRTLAAFCTLGASTLRQRCRPGPVLLPALPGAQDLGSCAEPTTADHVDLGQPEGDLFAIAAPACTGGSHCTS